MRKTIPASLLPVIVSVLLVGTIAAAPAVLSQPAAPMIEATANAEELTISWDRIPGAQYYTVGWINWTEGQPVHTAGGDWLSLFHYTTVAGDRTSYTVKGLNGGDSHFAIIRATDVAGASGRFGGGYSTWSSWSSSSAQPAGQHGEGFCPITGLPLPPTGYLSVNQSTESVYGTFTLTEATHKANVLLGDDRFPPSNGRMLVKVCGRFQAGNEFPGWFYSPAFYQVDTDAGLAFTALDDDVTSWNGNGSVPAGQSRNGCETWEVPSNATTVIVAINNWQATTALYQVQLP